MEAAKLTGAVREVEASLSKRISRLEDEVADHSGHIQDLRSKSFEAEQSMGRLLSAVEGFCEQAAIRLETRHGSGSFRGGGRRRGPGADGTRSVASTGSSGEAPRRLLSPILHRNPCAPPKRRSSLDARSRF